MNLENFPKLPEVKKAIAKLQRTEFPIYSEGTDISDFVKKVTAIIEKEIAPIISFKQPLELNNFSFRFFRARDLNSITNINLIRDHSYPPINNVGMGRCHFPKLPVFYCSDSALISLIEVIKNQDNSTKKYCVSKWEIIPSIGQLIFESFVQIGLPKGNNYKVFSESIGGKIEKIIRENTNFKIEKIRIKGLVEFLKFLDNSFISDNNYSLSAALAYNSLYINHPSRTDILMYPSVQSRYKGMNFAIHPNFVENNLKMSRLYIMEVKDFNLKTNKIEVSVYKYAEVEKNIIVWKGVNKEDNHYNSIVKQDFGNMLNGKFENI